MKKLSYDVLREINYQEYLLESAPERILQFGEGNFLRGFVNYFVDLMNEKAGFNSKTVVVQPIAAGLADMINEQDGLYTLYLRGMENGQKVNRKRVISNISRCLNPYNEYKKILELASSPELRYIVSNTTEAGIVFEEDSTFDQEPPASFPAKLTRFLFERYQQGLPGFIILSCELIDNNGQELKKCVDKYITHWQLPEAFAGWVESENVFCSTLVDRIVTGYPRPEAEALNQENGYIDNLIDTAEVFGFWVIEGPDSLKQELPVAEAGLPVIIVDDHSPYKQRKVRILNGAHTSMIMAAYLAGQNIVRECMDDETIREFMNRTIYEEIIPTLTLPEAELKEFAASVTERFANPFIDHSLLAISLNSISKWRARVMPSLLGFCQNTNTLPPCITLSFAAMLAFYSRGEELHEDHLLARRDGETYQIKDDRWVLEFFYENRGSSPLELTALVAANTKMWGRDLSELTGFVDQVSKYLKMIREDGMRKVLEEVLA